MNGATAYDSGLMKISFESSARTKLTLTYPVPSKSAGTVMCWTELVPLEVNHVCAYTRSRSSVMSPLPAYGAVMAISISSPARYCSLERWISSSAFFSSERVTAP